jgi:lipoyl(octanoyl) transferase
MTGDAASEASGPHRPGIWRAVDLGLIEYTEAQAIQIRIRDARLDGRITDDVALFCEHPPVFTLGRRGGRENLRVSPELLAEKGVPVVQAERGGNITYHGPGQLIVYPIIDLEGARLSVVDYVTALETVMIRTAADFGVTAGRSEVNRGVWVGDRKLGSVGIALRRGISWHGLAFNADPDLTPFGWIHPCGLSGVRMTSLARETETQVDLTAVKDRMRDHLADVFSIRDLRGFQNFGNLGGL